MPRPGDPLGGEAELETLLLTSPLVTMTRPLSRGGLMVGIGGGGGGGGAAEDDSDNPPIRILPPSSGGAVSGSGGGGGRGNSDSDELPRVSRPSAGNFNP